MLLPSGGILTGVQTLLATTVCGVLQAVLGGQPLLIVGVAEPIVLVYHYMFDFANKQAGLGPGLYLAWASWVCVFAGIMILVLAAVNSCRFINKFTRFSGELFGMLIAVLFLQQTVKVCRGCEALCFGLSQCCLSCRHAHLHNIALPLFLVLRRVVMIYLRAYHFSLTRQGSAGHFLTQTATVCVCNYGDLRCSK